MLSSGEMLTTSLLVARGKCYLNYELFKWVDGDCNDTTLKTGKHDPVVRKTMPNMTVFSKLPPFFGPTLIETLQRHYRDLLET